MALTLGEAAKQVTASKSTLLRAIKSGRLSATKARGSDAWAIDPAELFRVFDPVPSKARPQAPETVSEGPGLAEKDATIATLKAQLEAAQERNEELRVDRDRWAAQADKLLQLTVVSPPSKPGLWTRLSSAIKG